MVSNNELLELTSVEMRRRIGTKEISPVELLEASIARIEALNPAVNAIAATDFATARKLAVSAEASIARVDIGCVPPLPAQSCNLPGQRDRFNARDHRRIGAFGLCGARRAARHR